jgi:diacylglycerol kinase family enzyme
MLVNHFFFFFFHFFKATGNMENVIGEIEDCFRDEEEEKYKIHISRYRRDAIAVVYNYISAFPKNETVRVYAVGGDGILFECLNGMVYFPNAELTSVPYGNANDFIRTFGEGVNDKFRDIKGLINAPSRPIDIIHCGSNYAINGVTVGVIGQTIIEANKIFPRFPAKWLRKNIGTAYILCAVKALLNKTIMRQRYALLLDGVDFSGQYCNIHVGNHACNGGTMTQSSYAMPDDGVLNAILAQTTSGLRIAMDMNDYNSGLFEKFDYFIHKEFEVMEIKSDDMLCVEMDGEGFYAHKLEVKVIPNGIKVFAPGELEYMDYSYKAFKPKKKEAV